MTTPNIVFATGAPVGDKWGQYNLYSAPVSFNGNQTKWVAIVKDSELVTMATPSYHVLPNEEAVKLADMAAKESGLVPFNEFSGDWFARMGSHVIVDKWKVHALYALNEPYDVNGDKMHIGVGIHNSIDGTTAFGCGVFTFRHACANMVLAGSKGYSQEFDQRRTIEYVYKKHTVSIEPVLGQLQYTIQSVMDRAVGIMEAYKRIAQIKATEDRLNQIAQDLKKRKMPEKLTPEYLVLDKNQVRLQTAQELTVWDVYNELTRNIWHAEKGTLSRRIQMFDTVHKVIPLTVR